MTPLQQDLIALIADEGAIGVSQAAEIYRRNERTARVQLNALVRLGLIEPIRYAEWRLSEAGRKYAEKLAKERSAAMKKPGKGEIEHLRKKAAECRRKDRHREGVICGLCHYEGPAGDELVAVVGGGGQ